MKKIVVLIFIAVVLHGQTNDPYKIIDQLKTRLDKVNDYSADVSINIDMDFLQMPDSKAKIYFKKPDKFRIKSDGFAMLPKQGLNFSPVKFFNEDFDAIYVKKDSLNNKSVDVIKVLPRSDSSNIILSTLWVDTENDVVLKLEANTKSAGTFGIDFEYDSAIEYGLPDIVLFSLNIKNVRLPNISPKNVEDKRSAMRTRNVEGVVTIMYSNYSINKGIIDSVFTEE